MLSFSLLCLSPFTFLPCPLKLRSVWAKQNSYILNISTKCFSVFCHPLRLSLFWAPCFPFILLKGRGLTLSCLCSAPQSGNWKSVSPLLSKAVAWLPFHPSHIKFPLALRLTSHPYVTPIMSTCSSVSKERCHERFWQQTHDVSLPLDSATCQPGWCQCPGDDPFDPLLLWYLASSPVLFTWPLLRHAGLPIALPCCVITQDCPIPKSQTLVSFQLIHAHTPIKCSWWCPEHLDSSISTQSVSLAWLSLHPHLTQTLAWLSELFSH